MSVWGLDLGTTNSGLARWNAGARRAELIELPRICRRADALGAEELGAGRMVPSCIVALEPDLRVKIGRLPLLRDWVFIGEEAEIGRPAHEPNAIWPTPSYCPSFKAALARDPLFPVAHVGRKPVSAREAARLYVRELLDEVQQVTGERIRDIVVASPIDSFESYRAELRAVLESAGIRTVRFVDEPVAAAIGYGVGLDKPREVVVVDIGGGTCHVARVRLSPRGVDAGGCEVLAKEGHPIGGDTVDRWILDAVAERAGIRLDDGVNDETTILWRRSMLAEARRVKEALHVGEEATFTLFAPEELRGLKARATALSGQRWTAADLTGVLEARGLYSLLEGQLARVARGGASDVLLIGGSTLLPGIYPRLEAHFGRDAIRAWQPFEAVALGAAAFGGGDLRLSDFIVHDYALVTHARGGGAKAHTVVVPRGTPVPCADVWHRQLVPACPLGEPETLFKLLVAEIGHNDEAGVKFGWDAGGGLRPLDRDTDGVVVVPLNEANPTLGTIDPPHQPSDNKPRLDVRLGVNAERWLIATVTDLRTQRVLMKGQPVVRLL